MCTRYTCKDVKALIALCEALGIGPGPLSAAPPRFNAGIAQRLPVVASRPRAELTEMEFGIELPARATGERPLRLANARAETLMAKPTFRDATLHRRCLVPADGFYEWERSGAARLPHFFHLKDDKPFFFAGLWQPESADRPAGFVIVTTEANPVVGVVHDRMPVILGPNSGPAWLGAEPLDPARVTRLCRPLPADMMASHRVDPRMNRVGYESPDCVKPV